MCVSHLRFHPSENRSHFQFIVKMVWFVPCTFLFFFLFQQTFTFAQAHFTNASATNFFFFRLSKIFVAMIHIKCYFGNCIHIPIWHAPCPLISIDLSLCFACTVRKKWHLREMLLIYCRNCHSNCQTFCTHDASRNISTKLHDFHAFPHNST